MHIFSHIKIFTNSGPPVFKSLSTEGLFIYPVALNADEYPCGEGAGYAGGIVSSGIDGLRIAEAVAERAG
jgi:hypothetical protein